MTGSYILSFLKSCPERPMDNLEWPIQWTRYLIRTHSTETMTEGDIVLTGPRNPFLDLWKRSWRLCREGEAVAKSFTDTTDFMYSLTNFGYTIFVQLTSCAMSIATYATERTILTLSVAPPSTAFSLETRSGKTKAAGSKQTSFDEGTLWGGEQVIFREPRQTDARLLTEDRHIHELYVTNPQMRHERPLI